MVRHDGRKGKGRRGRQKKQPQAQVSAANDSCRDSHTPHVGVKPAPASASAPAPAVAPSACGQPLPPPAYPNLLNRRPRRVRPAVAANSAVPSDDGLRSGQGLLGRNAGTPIRLEVRDMPLLPPPRGAYRPPGLHGTRAKTPLAGLKYGPSNTCAVDTFLTLLVHALTPEEHQLLRSIGVETAACTSAAPCARADPCAAVVPRASAGPLSPAPRALLRALRATRDGCASYGWTHQP